MTEVSSCGRQCHLPRLVVSSKCAGVFCRHHLQIGRDAMSPVKREARAFFFSSAPPPSNIILRSANSLAIYPFDLENISSGIVNIIK